MRKETSIQNFRLSLKQNCFCFRRDHNCACTFFPFLTTFKVSMQIIGLVLKGFVVIHRPTLVTLNVKFSLNNSLVNLQIKMFAEIGCHRSYSKDAARNLSNGLCYRWEATRISFFLTQKSDCQEPPNWFELKKSSAAHLHYIIHEGEGWGVGQSAIPIVIFASYLAALSNFSL